MLFDPVEEGGTGDPKYFCRLDLVPLLDPQGFEDIILFNVIQVDALRRERGRAIPYVPIIRFLMQAGEVAS